MYVCIATACCVVSSIFFPLLHSSFFKYSWYLFVCCTWGTSYYRTTIRSKYYINAASSIFYPILLSDKRSKLLSSFLTSVASIARVHHNMTNALYYKLDVCFSSNRRRRWYFDIFISKLNLARGGGGASNTHYSVKMIRSRNAVWIIPWSQMHGIQHHARDCRDHTYTLKFQLIFHCTGWNFFHFRWDGRFRRAKKSPRLGSTYRSWKIWFKLPTHAVALTLYLWVSWTI